MARDNAGKELGQGRSSFVEALSSAGHPCTVIKNGVQGNLVIEAEKMTCTGHSSICHLLAFLHDGDQPHPDQIGYLVMEQLGDSLDKYFKTHDE